MALKTHEQLNDNNTNKNVHLNSCPMNIIQSIANVMLFDDISENMCFVRSVAIVLLNE